MRGNFLDLVRASADVLQANFAYSLETVDYSGRRYWNPGIQPYTRRYLPNNVVRIFFALFPVIQEHTSLIRMPSSGKRSAMLGSDAGTQQIVRLTQIAAKDSRSAPVWQRAVAHRHGAK
jgi:hypothetical protein